MPDCTATQHGDLFAYLNRKCRCPSAREEYRLYRKRLRGGRQPYVLVPATGTARRLQSLVASGHRQIDLAKALGFSKERLNALIFTARPRVKRETEARVKQLFARLDGKDGGSAHARTAAKRNGWVDLAAWDDVDDPTEKPKLGRIAHVAVDEMKVQRAVRGDKPVLTRAEKRLAVQILTERRKSQTEIADILGTSKRAVCRHRARVRELAAA